VAGRTECAPNARRFPPPGDPFRATPAPLRAGPFPPHKPQAVMFPPGAISTGPIATPPMDGQHRRLAAAMLLHQHPVIPQDPPGANPPDSGVPVTAAALVPPACQARMSTQRGCRRDHPGTRCQRKRLRRACKPDSVQGRAPWATIPLDEPLPARSSCQPGPLGRSHPATEAARGPYSALLPVGLAVPVRLPVPRWALTPPFHPYLRSPARPCAEGGLFSVALSVGLPRPGVTRHRRFVKSGLSSAPEMNPVPRPPGPPQKALRRPAPPRSSPARQGPAARVAPSRTGHPGRACAPARSLHGRSLPRARCPSAP